jgi:hypothetical protein
VGDLAASASGLEKVVFMKTISTSGSQRFTSTRYLKPLAEFFIDSHFVNIRGNLMISNIMSKSTVIQTSNAKYEYFDHNMLGGGFFAKVYKGKNLSSGE